MRREGFLRGRKLSSLWTPTGSCPRSDHRSQAGNKAATDLPLVAQPNAGRPKLVDGRTAFEMAPGPFAEGIAACIDAGARIVGGCCGTTPEHIRAVHELIKTM